MSSLEFIAVLMFWVQLAHSIEELMTGFNKKWFFFKLSFKKFILFEIIHTIFWALIIFSTIVPFRQYLLAIFIVLMFSQSLWHLAWWAMKKQYVPGLLTAWVHVVLFLSLYFRILF